MTHRHVTTLFLLFVITLAGCAPAAAPMAEPAAPPTVAAATEAPAATPEPVAAEALTATPAPAEAASTPEEVAGAFFRWYLDAIGSPATGDFKNPLVDHVYRDSPYLSPAYVARVDEIIAGFDQAGGGYDPFLQAQDIPQGFEVEAGPTADTALVRLQFGPNSTRDLLVTVIAENDLLLIDDIAPLEPEAETAPAGDRTEDAAEPSLAGRWEGSLKIAGLDLAIAVTFGASDPLTGTLDIPAQGALGLPLADVRYVFPRLTFLALAGTPQEIAFAGEITAAGAITGTLQQSGYDGVFDLQRPETAEAETLPYSEEEVTIRNGEIDLAGTLTLPPGAGPHPAVLLVSGSGQQNRDEEIPIVPGYRPFRVLADSLTRQGIAVLRYDDRGVGGSTGDPASGTTADFAADAEAAFDYLLARPEINAEQAGILGHSEGGMIAAMVAARNPDVAFVISMAGDAVSGYDILLKQVERIARAAGYAEDEVAEAVEQQTMILDWAMAGDFQAIEDFIYETILEQMEALPDEQKAELGGDAGLEVVARQRTQIQVDAIKSPWYQFFLAYDPGQDWARISVPVLGLYGEKDVQVDATQNVPALEAALAEAGNQDVTIHVFPTANHLFQDAQSGGLEEYATLPPDFVTGFLEIIGEWLLARVAVYD